MRVLIGCECSGIVREAFRRRSHDAWSCDIKPAEDESPFHLQQDVLAVFDQGWDLAIFHPACKFLANSGSKHLYNGMKKENGRNEQRWSDMYAAADFYLKCWKAPIPRVCVENPVWHGHGIDYIQHNAPDHPRRRQFVQPWWFGHMEIKATGLALKNLPPLRKTHDVHAEMMRLEYKDRAIVHHMAPGPEREADRSRTKLGLAHAMAEQWG